MTTERELLSHDLDILEAMLAEMDDYLASDATHWTMGQIDTPKLTIGGFLMRLDRLTAVQSQLWPEAQDRLNAVIQMFGEVTRGHVVRFEFRTHQELRARLSEWVHYMRNLSKRLAADAAFYGRIADTRVVAQAMMQRLSGPPYRLEQDILKAFDTLDRNLRRRWADGEFIWPEVWQPAYDRKTYWYLYGQPK